ncbi:MAG: PASTA domain-containing protein, partial [Terracidiphilus sp.]
PITEDDSAPPQEDIQALYDAANDLPSDDPLSAATKQETKSTASPASASPQSAPQQATASNSAATAQSAPPAPQPENGAQPVTKTIPLPDDKQLRVPSLIGLPVREVIEQAGAAGLEVEITGVGIAREQAPVPGTMVAPGTKIVVRCTR